MYGRYPDKHWLHYDIDVHFPHPDWQGSHVLAEDKNVPVWHTVHTEAEEQAKQFGNVQAWHVLLTVRKYATWQVVHCEKLAHILQLAEQAIHELLLADR